MCSLNEDGCPEGAGGHPLIDFTEVETEVKEIKEWISSVSSCDD